MLRIVLRSFFVFVCASMQVVGQTHDIDISRPGTLFANRLQDWRVNGEALECVEGAANLPLRSAMLLEHSVGGGGAFFELTVTTHGAMPSGEGSDVEATDDLRGVLIGVGNDGVDHRISALVHHRPAEDGGLFIAVDAHGAIGVFDMSAPSTAGGTWSLGGPLGRDELPRLVSQPARVPASSQSITLHVIASGIDAETATLIAYAFDESGEMINGRVMTTTPDRIDGLVGLASHRGRRDDTDVTHSFSDLKLKGAGVRQHPERRFGPIVTTHYTVDDDLLTLTAQCLPLSDALPSELSLRIGDAGIVDTALIDRASCTATFRVPNWNASRTTPYEVLFGDGNDASANFGGTIRAAPPNDRPFVLASLNCQKIFTGGLKWNENGIWFPHAETARHVALHDPDFLFFAGDQIYEGDLDPVDARSEEKLRLDYLYKFYRHCWSFRELTRHVPSVVIPDDHDVYHGNLWGAGGRHAVADKSRGLTSQDSGGYKHSADFVNVVHRTQTSHLPTPEDDAPVDRGISVYTTDLTWGGLSFAVLADRQWKSSASVMVPEGKVVNGWFQAEGFDPRDADVPGAVLLGDRQLAFLERWADDERDDVWTKVALSQTPFVNVATLPDKSSGGGVLPSLPIPEPGAYPEGYRFAADTDSGGWPQTGRNRAVELLRRAGAVHLAGDQHLGSLVEYGIDEHRDAGFAFTAPAVANTWPRRWWPPVHGGNPEPGAPHFTGDFEDGFGNKLTVWAVANPVQSHREPSNLYDRTPGYGIVRFDPTAQQITFECWPRWVDPREPAAAQYAGWPKTIDVAENR